MPTVFTHPVIALALSPWMGPRRIPMGTLALGALCTLVPDLDVIGLRLGIPYDSTFGHRGFSHSLLFAALLAGCLTALLPRLRSDGHGLSRFLFLFGCTVSHGLLDALTNGGHGVGFLAPFSNERYFLPWRPIEVSPLSLSRFLSGQAWPVLRSELLWVGLPALAAALAGCLLRRGRGTWAGAGADGCRPLPLRSRFR